MGSTRLKDKKAEEARLKEEKKETVKHKAEKQVDVRSIVRVLGTDLDGEKPVYRAITKIKGIRYSMSKAVCNASKIDPKKKLGNLDEKELEKLEEVIKEPLKFNIPTYFVNRRRDLATGKDMHLTGMDLTVARRFDIQKQIDMKTYRGWRHMLGQPVRGQRTRSSFRGTGKAVGVVKKEIKLQMAKKPEEVKEKK
jgi:small subunit ribosomal protein S13